MSAADDYARARNQTRIADAVRIAAVTEARRLGIPEGPELRKVVADATANAAQSFRLIADADVGLELGDPKQMPTDVACALEALMGRRVF